MRVYGYCRVSTEEQAVNGASLAAQEDKIRQYSSLYDLDVVEVVVDAGVSAKSLNRPGIQHVLESLNSGAGSGIVITKLDRLCRSVSDWGHLIDKFFGKSFALFSVSDQIDTRSASGRMGLNILMSVAQWEREIIGERTSAALQHRKSKGVILGPPRLQDTVVIKRMVELRAQGKSLAAIADILAAEGRPTLRGGTWKAATVRKVLQRQ